MTTGPATRLNRRALIAVCCLAGLAVVLATVDGSAAPAIGPDVTVFQFTDIGNYGSSGGFVGYSIGTRSCNRGDTPLNWCDQASGCAPGATTKDHPVIAQNLYRLKNGRFQQIGMSWLKHGFTSTNSSTGGCAGFSGQGCTFPPAGGNQLGVGCTDPYVASLNGSQPLGRRSVVNATTGDFPFPNSSPNGPYSVSDERIKVAMTDLDPAQNAGATYWAEGHYIAPDDAASGNSFNNASHRQVTVGGAPTYGLTMTGTFFEQLPAIFAWPAHDIGVILVNVDVPGPLPERFYVGRKVTDLGKGLWHYEYVVHNLNSDRSARALSIEFPVATAFTNVGFKGIAHHSGEPYATDDWTVSSGANLLSWSTDTFATNPNAHALRFATMFNFWFDADQPPTEAMVHTLGLFKTGDPSEVEFAIVNNLFSDDLESGGIGSWSSHR
ncbi:MAG TPA: hypothetical protein VLB76_14710 [Thermoanaerobaculia bacterium]|jgi:hypothetical protein|nr:hypothetical protein [Thermoanaerobaculia bacterium]